jgi:hypothetical protein
MKPMAPRVPPDFTLLIRKELELAGAKSYEEAIAEYDKAWKLLPDPKNKWNATTWIRPAIAGAAFLEATSLRQERRWSMR